MAIEFIRDEFLEGKKQELDNINKVLSEKPKKVDRNVIFLRRFTLALMGQYKVKKYIHEKHEEIERINKVITEHTNELYKSHEVPRPQYQRVPVPTMQRGRIPINTPSPIKEEIKVPKPIKVENYSESIPVKAERKEFNIPNPL